MTVRVEGNDNRTAGGDYLEDRSVRVSIGSVSIGMTGAAVASAASVPDLQAQYSQHAHLSEVRKVLLRRFMLHRAVYVHLASVALMAVVMLFAWGDPPGSPASLLLIAVALGAVAPSAFWMVHERNARYAELQSIKEELLAVERVLVRMEAEAEVNARKLDAGRGAPAFSSNQGEDR